ncbi:hypothetical protein [Marinomonas fungiae]|uniref:hypothetical protein n=1 Tax=Marinomonas fungiae TaxID=1137284 RepID=UPI003A8F42A4
MKCYVLMLTLAYVTVSSHAAEVKVSNSESFDGESGWSVEAFEALEQYLNAQERAGYNGRSLETYRLLSSSDQNAITKAEYLKTSLPPRSDEIYNLTLKLTTYDLQGFQRNSIDSLVYTIEGTNPKLESGLFWELYSEWTPETDVKVAKYLSGRNVPLSIYTFQLTMLKEDNVWKAHFGLARKMKAKQMYQNSKIPVDRFASYSGAQLKPVKDDLIYFKTELEKVLKLDSGLYDATSDLKEVDRLLEKLDNFEQYSKLLKIKDLKVAESMMGEDGIFGSIKNSSNQSFDKIQITIYYLDGEGKAIYEVTYTPISVSKYSSDTPLKANYVKEFGIKAETPLGWSKKVKAVISDIEVSTN